MSLHECLLAAASRGFMAPAFAADSHSAPCHSAFRNAVWPQLCRYRDLCSGDRVLFGFADRARNNAAAASAPQRPDQVHDECAFVDGHVLHVRLCRYCGHLGDAGVSGFSQAFAATAVSMVALPTALSQAIVGWLLRRVNRPAIAVAASALASASFLTIPFIESGAAFLVAFAILGAASFALYTCALTLLGERYAGDGLMTGSAAFSLAYAAGSGSGSAVVGAVMSGYSLAAGPVTIGAARAIVALACAVSDHRKFRSRLKSADIECGS